MLLSKDVLEAHSLPLPQGLEIDEAPLPVKKDISSSLI